MSTGAERQILALVVPFDRPNSKDDRLYEAQDFVAFVASEPTAGLYMQHGRYDIGRYSEQTAIGALRHFAIVQAWKDRPGGVFALGHFFRSPRGDDVLAFAQTQAWHDEGWGVSAGFGEMGPGQGEAILEVSMTPDPAFEEARVAAIGENAGRLWTTLTGLSAPVPPVPTFEVQGDWVLTTDGKLRRQTWMIG